MFYELFCLPTITPYSTVGFLPLQIAGTLPWLCLPACSGQVAHHFDGADSKHMCNALVLSYAMDAHAPRLSHVVMTCAGRSSRWRAFTKCLRGGPGLRSALSNRAERNLRYESTRPTTNVISEGDHVAICSQKCRLSCTKSEAEASNDTRA